MLPAKIAENYRRLQEMASGYRQSSAILTANELGVFKALSEGDASAQELSLKLSLSPRALKTLLDALTGLKILTCDRGKYSLSGPFKPFIQEGSEYYLGDIFRHYFRLFKRWVRLDEVIRSGEPIGQARNRDEQDLNAFILGMHNLASSPARELSQAIELAGVNSILDLGGGPGTYLMEMLKLSPQARGVIFDLPNVIPIAQRVVKENGMEARVSFISGDMLTDDYGGPYDLIILSSIIHSHSESENRLICRNCFESLRLSGRLVVKDFLLEEDGASPASAALFSLNMLLGTEEGRSYKWSEVKGWLREAGFTVVQCLTLSGEAGAIVGRRI